MKYYGVLARIYENDKDKIYLFFQEPKTKIIKDGLDLQDESGIYNNLPYDTLMVVDIVLKDGTKEVEIDLDDFIGGKYGKYDIFIHIRDLMPFRLGNKIKNDGNEITFKPVEQVIHEGEFQMITEECIEHTLEELKNNNMDV